VEAVLQLLLHHGEVAYHLLVFLFTALEEGEALHDFLLLFLELLRHTGEAAFEFIVLSLGLE
jgi:hypothetical protein